MKPIINGAFAFTGVVLVMLMALSAYELPRGVRFVAPHQSALGAVVGRVSLNPRWSARLADRLLHVAIPTVYAGCTAPACDGTKVVPDPSGVNNQPYCWYDGTNYSCAKLTCAYVGGSNKCDGPYQTDCKIPYHPGIYCNYAKKVSCQ